MPIQRPKRNRSRSSWYANLLNDLIRVVGVIAMIIVAAVVYRYLFKDIITGKSHFFAYLFLWLISAYIILPRIYRAVSKIFVPNYFFGRTQTADGLLGDPINIAFNGKKEQIIETMTRAGWRQAEPLKLNSGLKMSYAAVFGRKYPNAPVSALFLFNRKQDLAFEQDLHGNPRKRHHIRLWKTPEKWWLPGGYKADWLAAATFDKNVGLSLFTGQVTHKIDADVDSERDFVIYTLRKNRLVSEVKFVKHFTSSYHTRNGGGSVIHTDGALPFVTIND